MTPRERYDLQISATVFGIVGCILLWWALWSGGWSKTKTTDVSGKQFPFNSSSHVASFRGAQP